MTILKTDFNDKLELQSHTIGKLDLVRCDYEWVGKKSGQKTKGQGRKGGSRDPY